MIKNFLIATTASVVAGGIIYSLVVLLVNYFAPIVAVIAGFVSGIGLVVLSRYNKENNKDISAVGLCYFGVVAVMSLFTGYLLIYYFKPVIIHGIMCHPKNFIAFPQFIVNTLKIPDILSTIFGGIAASALSHKIRAIYEYFRRSSPV